jgi:hypothetical protein
LSTKSKPKIYNATLQQLSKLRLHANPNLHSLGAAYGDENPPRVRGTYRLCRLVKEVLLLLNQPVSDHPFVEPFEAFGRDVRVGLFDSMAI